MSDTKDQNQQPPSQTTTVTEGKQEAPTPQTVTVTTPSINATVASLRPHPAQASKLEVEYENRPKTQSKTKKGPITDEHGGTAADRKANERSNLIRRMAIEMQATGRYGADAALRHATRFVEQKEAEKENWAVAAKMTPLLKEEKKKSEQRGSLPPTVTQVPLTQKVQVTLKGQPDQGQTLGPNPYKAQPYGYAPDISEKDIEAEGTHATKQANEEAAHMQYMEAVFKAATQASVQQAKPLEQQKDELVTQINDMIANGEADTEEFKEMEKEYQRITNVLWQQHQSDTEEEEEDDDAPREPDDEEDAAHAALVHSSSHKKKESEPKSSGQKRQFFVDEEEAPTPETKEAEAKPRKFVKVTPSGTDILNLSAPTDKKIVEAPEIGKRQAEEEPVPPTQAGVKRLKTLATVAFKTGDKNAETIQREADEATRRLAEEKRMKQEAESLAELQRRRDLEEAQKKTQALEQELAVERKLRRDAEKSKREQRMEDFDKPPPPPVKKDITKELEEAATRSKKQFEDEIATKMQKIVQDADKRMEETIAHAKASWEKELQRIKSKPAVFANQTPEQRAQKIKEAQKEVGAEQAALSSMKQDEAHTTALMKKTEEANRTIQASKNEMERAKAAQEQARAEQAALASMKQAEADTAAFMAARKAQMEKEPGPVPPQQEEKVLKLQQPPAEQKYVSTAPGDPYRPDPTKTVAQPVTDPTPPPSPDQGRYHGPTEDFVLDSEVEETPPPPPPPPTTTTTAAIKKILGHEPWTKKKRHPPYITWLKLVEGVNSAPLTGRQLNTQLH